MRLDEKNKILKLRDTGASLREMAKAMSMSTSALHEFLNANVDVRDYSSCPVCGKSIMHHKHKGRHRIYCSNKCRYSSMARKRDTRICLFCHKPFKAYSYSGAKFCSHECYMRYRYGK